MASPVKEARTKQNQAGFTEVVERKLGSLRSRKPGTNQFALDTQVGGRGWHFGSGPFTEANEVDTAWAVGDSAPYRRRMILADYNAFAGLDDALNFDAGQIVKYVHPSTGANITFQPQQLQWTNDLDQIQNAGDVGLVAGSVNGDVIRWNNAFGSGRHFEWETQTTRLSKRLIVDTLVSLPTPNATILSGGNPVLRLQFIFQKSANVDIHVDGVLWNEAANNPQTTTGAIEFRTGGTPLWYFVPAQVWDSGKNGAPVVVQRIRKQGPNLFVEVRVPWSWIQPATFPIYIDPTIDEQIASDNGDGFEHGPDTTWVYDGYDADGLVIGYSIGGFTTCDAGFVFEGVAVPTSSTITAAYVQLFAKWQDGDIANTPIITKGFAQDNAATFATDGSNRPSTRTKTTSTVSQTMGTVTDEAWKQFNSIVTIIQEIVDRGGWASGNSVGLVIEDNGSTSGQRGQFQDYNRSAGDAAKLHIEYTAAAAAVRPPKNVFLNQAVERANI